MYCDTPKSQKTKQNPFSKQRRIKAQHSRKALEDFVTQMRHPQEWSHMTVTDSTKNFKDELKMLSDKKFTKESHSTKQALVCQKFGLHTVDGQEFTNSWIDYKDQENKENLKSLKGEEFFF